MKQANLDKENSMMKLESCNEDLPMELPLVKSEPPVEKDPAASPFSLAQEFDTIVGDLDIPEFLKERQTTLRFPEKLMLLLVEVERITSTKGRSSQKACLAWKDEGRAFVIRQGEELIGKILPMISCPAKYPSFLRKLYRWGFRQVVDRSAERLDKEPKSKEKVFMHPYFQRDNKPLMDRMKSITAEGTRKEMATRAYIDNQEARLSKQEIGNSGPQDVSIAIPGMEKLQSNSVPVLHGHSHSLAATIGSIVVASEAAKGCLSFPTMPPKTSLGMDALHLAPSYLVPSSSLGSLPGGASAPLSLHGLADELVREVRLQTAANELLLQSSLGLLRQRNNNLFTRPSLSDYHPPLSNVFATTAVGRLELLGSLMGGGYRTAP